MALTRWDDNDFFANPFRALLDPRLLGPSLLTAPVKTDDLAAIRVDVLEKDEKFTVKADLPGIPKEKVNLSVDGDLLTLSVADTTKEEKDETIKGYKVHRIERASAFARRVIRLPDSADTDKISAHVDAGVLEVNIPKKQMAHQRKRHISIADASLAEEKKA